MKGELTTTELRVSAGCGNVPSGEDSVSPPAPQQAGAGRLQRGAASLPLPAGLLHPGISFRISKKVTGESFTFSLLFPGYQRLHRARALLAVMVLTLPRELACASGFGRWQLLQMVGGSPAEPPQMLTCSSPLVQRLNAESLPMSAC